MVQGIPTKYGMAHCDTQRNRHSFLWPSILRNMEMRKDRFLRMAEHQKKELMTAFVNVECEPYRLLMERCLVRSGIVSAFSCIPEKSEFANCQQETAVCTNHVTFLRCTSDYSSHSIIRHLQVTAHQLVCFNMPVLAVVSISKRTSTVFCI